MHERAQVRVVEIEHVRAHAVHERRVQAVEALAAADYARLRRAREGRQGCERAVDRFVMRPAERAAHVVNQRADRLAPGGGGYVLRSRVDDEACERARDLHQSTLMFAARTTFVHLSRSVRTNAAACSGLLPIDSKPVASSRCFTSGATSSFDVSP